MHREGPPLEVLIHRLGETPPDFLAEPRIGVSGQVHVAAVVSDLLERLGHQPAATELEFSGKDVKRDRSRLSIVLLFCWILADESFRDGQTSVTDVLDLLGPAAGELSQQANAAKFLRDPDRREELVRTALSRLGFRPAGETVAQAQDRLSSISSIERARVIKAARAAEERAREIREALMRKAAQESADKYTRE